ncbi:MAG: alpha/beta hydrolase [Myxococcota bacterium]|nr:alpha/beta hydrolase [Myxococcota bacterium]
MPSAPHVVRAGAGPRLLLIHGSAADHSTWSIQLASSLREQFTLITYDRRSDALTVEDHADDAVALLAADPAPAIVIGSSFGAVIALDAIRRHGSLFAGAVLIEPPMAASDGAPPEPELRKPALDVRVGFLAAFDLRAAEQGGPAAAELFLRTVLGDASYERMPRAYQERSKSKWAEIRADSAALIAYRPRYAELAGVTTPVLLLGGERSAAYFRPTLEALAAALADARLEVVPAAGHMLHAEAHRRFAELVSEFARSVGLAPS